MSSMEQNRAWPSKAEAARNAHEAAQKARQKEGGLWNFLTWAFFISQTLGGDQFIGAAAAATAEGDPQARKGDGSDEVAKNPGLGQPTGTRTDAGEEAPGAAGQSHATNSNGPADGPDSLSTYADLPELSAVGRAPAEQSSAGAVQQAAYEDAESNGPGGGGGSTPADNPSLPGAGGHGLLPDIGVGPIFDAGGLLPGIGDGVSDVIDGLVDNAVLPLTDTIAELVQTLTGTVDDLVGSIDGLLDNAVAPLTDALDTIVEGTVSALLANVDDLAGSLGHGLGEVAAPLTGTIDDVVETLDSTVGAAAPALTGLVSGLTGGPGGQGENNSGPLQDAVASSGQIVFKALPVVDDLGGDLGLDNLFSGGGYTDYNLALRSDAADSAPSHGPAGTIGSSTLVDHILTGGNDPGQPFDNDQVRNVGLPSVLDEIALRGLGDGIAA
jgi:hypothetical protein